MFEEISRRDQYLVSLKRALRKRDVPRSVQDFLKWAERRAEELWRTCSVDGLPQALADQRSWR
jgi:hypothetical protein